MKIRRTCARLCPRSCFRAGFGAVLQSNSSPDCGISRCQAPVTARRGRAVTASGAGTDGGSGDGVVVTSASEGLSAWLATHSEPIRAGLISKSPVDLVIYGDLGTFSGDDGRRVLEALLAQPVSLSRALSSSTRFSPLVTSETESRIRSVLSSKERDWKQEIRGEIPFADPL